MHRERPGQVNFLNQKTKDKVVHPLIQTRQQVSLVTKNSWDIEGESSPPKICPAHPSARIEPAKHTSSFDFYGLQLESQLESTKQQLKNMRL